MRKLVALIVVAIAAAAIVGGVALAAKKPPVSLQGKVTNKGEKTVKKGKAHTRPIQGRGASNCMETQRKPLVLTKCSLLERTGSR